MCWVFFVVCGLLLFVVSWSSLPFVGYALLVVVIRVFVSWLLCVVVCCRLRVVGCPLFVVCCYVCELILCFVCCMCVLCCSVYGCLLRVFV